MKSSCAESIAQSERDEMIYDRRAIRDVQQRVWPTFGGRASGGGTAGAGAASKAKLMVVGRKNRQVRQIGFGQAPHRRMRAPLLSRSHSFLVANEFPKRRWCRSRLFAPVWSPPLASHHHHGRRQKHMGRRRRRRPHHRHGPCARTCPGCPLTPIDPLQRLIEQACKSFSGVCS